MENQEQGAAEPTPKAYAVERITSVRDQSARMVEACDHLLATIAKDGALDSSLCIAFGIPQTPPVKQ